MKDPSLPLQAAYITMLRDELGIDVYDSAGVPADAAPPYATVGEMTVLPSHTKSNYGAECTVTVQIHTAFDGAAGGKRDANTSGGEVVELLANRETAWDLGSDFTMVVTTLDFSQTFEDQSELKKYVRRILRFRHLIQQIT